MWNLENKPSCFQTKFWLGYKNTGEGCPYFCILPHQGCLLAFFGFLKDAVEYAPSHPRQSSGY